MLSIWGTILNCRDKAVNKSVSTQKEPSKTVGTYLVHCQGHSTVCPSSSEAVTKDISFFKFFKLFDSAYAKIGEK